MMSESKKLNTSRYNTLSFDCYGTLIDWETGILGYMQPLLQSYYINVIDEFVLEFFSQAEPRAQQDGRSYAEVLGDVVDQFAARLGFIADEQARRGFAESVAYWPAFSDSAAALAKLQQHFQLAIISNVDDNLFAESAANLKTQFNHVITAGAVGCYKPDPKLFEAALAKLKGPVLHVAQSRFHDILPATALGLDTVWINRPSGGAAAAVDANPTWTFNTMAEFAAAIEN